jgi:polyhydroxyalkanoate synthase
MATKATTKAAATRTATTVKKTVKTSEKKVAVTKPAAKSTVAKTGNVPKVTAKVKTPSAVPAAKKIAPKKATSSKPTLKPATKSKPVPKAKQVTSLPVDVQAQMTAFAENLQTQAAQVNQAAEELLKNAQAQAEKAKAAMDSDASNASESPFGQWQQLFNGVGGGQTNMPNIMGAWQQFGDTLKQMSSGQNPLAGQSMMAHESLSDVAKMVDASDLQRLQQEYLKEMAALWQSYSSQQSFDITDRRFVSPAWRANAWANYLAQSYLINARLMLEMADCVKADAKTKTRVRFAVMQWVDSLAPSNFFLTNPDAQQKLLDTKGESLKFGIQNFLTDLQKGRISQTDETAFEVGVNVARSGGAVVFENEYFQLLQYTPLTTKVGERPLLIVPPCINKFYILDLQPDNSLVRYAVENGNTVYLVSWRNADEALAHTTWDDYIEHVLIKAIHVVQEASTREKINVLGFCVGGTLLSTALAVLAARGEDAVASLTLLTALLDFSDNGVLDAYVDEKHVVMREQAFAKGGVMLGKELSNAFATLRPNDLVWNYVVSNYLKGEQPAAFDLLYWNSDSTNLPGPMFCWYLRNTYLENKLKDKGAAVVCGEKVDLKQVNVPTYVLSCREDHIVPWTAAYRSQATLAGDKKFVLAASGHIAGVVNSAKKNKRSYWTNDSVNLDKSTSEQWLNGADEHAGSWWTDWTNWLRAHSGKQVAAPNKLGTVKYKPIEAAPGRYVKVRAA